MRPITARLRYQFEQAGPRYETDGSQGKLLRPERSSVYEHKLRTRKTQFKWADTPKQGFYDKERLYSQAVSLKQNNNILSTELTKLKTKLAFMQKEVTKKERPKQAENSCFKSLLLQARAENQQLKCQINKLLREKKRTDLMEMQANNKQLQLEVARLKEALTVIKIAKREQKVKIELHHEQRSALQVQSLLEQIFELKQNLATQQQLNQSLQKRLVRERQKYKEQEARIARYQNESSRKTGQGQAMLQKLQSDLAKLRSQNTLLSRRLMQIKKQKESAVSAEMSRLPTSIKKQPVKRNSQPSPVFMSAAVKKSSRLQEIAMYISAQVHSSKQGLDVADLSGGLPPRLKLKDCISLLHEQPFSLQRLDEREDFAKSLLGGAESIETVQFLQAIGWQVQKYRVEKSEDLERRLREFVRLRCQELQAGFRQLEWSEDLIRFCQLQEVLLGAGLDEAGVRALAQQTALQSESMQELKYQAIFQKYYISE